MAPQRPMAPAIGVAGGMAEREAARRALFLERLAELEETRIILGELLEAGGPYVAHAVVEASRRCALRQRDPLAVAHAVLRARAVPAAVFVAEICREIGEIDQLVGELVRIVVGPDDD